MPRKQDKQGSRMPNVKECVECPECQTSLTLNPQQTLTLLTPPLTLTLTLNVFGIPGIWDIRHLALWAIPMHPADASVGLDLTGIREPASIKAAQCTLTLGVI